VVIGISTRGSSDAIVCAMVLGMSLLLQTGRLLPAAALHGLAVHWRIYPVIFAPTMLVFLQTWQDRARLSLCSFGTFALLGAACWGLYREQFLNETFLCVAACCRVDALPWRTAETDAAAPRYHITRTDIRHNFSAWFLALYLRMNQPANSFVGLATFAPQLATQAAIVAKFARCVAGGSSGFADLGAALWRGLRSQKGF
jgi:phosphatidylinositol glycan class M